MDLFGEAPSLHLGRARIHVQELGVRPSDLALVSFAQLYLILDSSIPPCFSITSSIIEHGTYP